MTYADATQYLFRLRRFGWRPGLATMERLLDLLGQPQDAVPAVQVGGTNGKGSTAAILTAILRAAGRRTALYTSPHLVSFTERIQVGGAPIPEAEVARLTAVLRTLCAEHFAPSGTPPHPTFFELTTAMAFCHFREQAADAAVIEVGLGGRLDATNVLRPLCTVITNIGLEHQEYLGSTVEEIAAEKAGIIKPGVPVITGAAGAALNVIRGAAEARNAPLTDTGQAYRASIRASGLEGVTFDLAGPHQAYPGLFVALPGRHQVHNAIAAIAAAETLERQAGLGVDEGAIRRGLREACWPGRLQVVAGRPRLLLDGAHNRDGVERLRAFLEEQRGALGPVVLVFGVLADKPYAEMLQQLLPVADAVVLTRPPADRAADPVAVCAAVGTSAPLHVEAEVPRALARARELAPSDGTVVACGSLYTVGAVLCAMRDAGDATPEPGDR